MTKLSGIISQMIVISLEGLGVYNIEANFPLFGLSMMNSVLDPQFTLELRFIACRRRRRFTQTHYLTAINFIRSPIDIATSVTPLTPILLILTPFHPY